MNARASGKNSETDWARVDAQEDDAIDTADGPELSDAFFARATLRRPGSPLHVAVPVEPEVLAWYREQGGEWEQRMAAALRIYAEAHKAASA